MSFANVKLPEQFPTTQPMGEAKTPATEASATENTPQEQSVVDLAKLEKFLFDGKEMTLDELKQERMRQKDYTKKTQEIAQERRFYKTLVHDLKTIEKNPTREIVNEFMRVYPKSFHSYLETIDLGDALSTGKDSHDKLPYEVRKELDELKSYVREKEIETIQADLEAKSQRFSKEFPEAIEDLVLARAESLINRLKNDNPNFEKLPDHIWKKLWKQSHEEMVSRLSKKKAATFNNQKQANAKAKEGSAGGGTVGTPPRRETIKEATARAVRELSSSKN